MVMNPEFETFDFIVNYQLEPVVFSLHQLNELIVFLKSKDLQLPVHIEIDTGMHRLGFSESDIDELIQIVSKSKEITIASVFSHLSASDEQQYDAFTKQQFELFHSISKRLTTALDQPFLKHISNTAAALRFSQAGLDMVRLGIGLYGIDPTGEFKNLLEPVFTLKTVISQIKTISANESIGYSRKSMSDHSRRIAIMALGYADGLNRALSNGKGGFLIRGKWAPIAGNICMDMCMVDITDIDCEEGDEAIVFGRELPIEQLAEKLNTIPYEILTSISQRVKRVYVSE
jgi:Alr-MurF fusion protein